MHSTIHRSCEFCSEAIRLCHLDGKWVPFDDDGRHRCRGRSYGSRNGQNVIPVASELAALPQCQIEENGTASAGLSSLSRNESENGSAIGCVACVIVLIVIAIQWFNWITTLVGQAWSGLFAS